MKFFHLADLHLGRIVNGFSMKDDQHDILHKITALAAEHKPDAVFIAGDVYDKSVPAEEAVHLFDRFLVRLYELGIAAFVVSGNHDSAERVAFGADLLKHSNVHIVQTYNGSASPIPLRDAHGEIDIWMLPYLKPSIVRKCHPDTEIVTYSDAVSAALGRMNIDAAKRNILIAHQFVTGAVTSESEEFSVGGSDNVDGSLFNGFDYVALGHLHRPQRVGRDTMRYSGSPLKYSFSEADHKKAVTVVEMHGKGDTVISELPLEPLHEMREIRGAYNDIMNPKNYRNTNTEDYIRVILTDERDEPDVYAKLRTVYPNLMRSDYDRKLRPNESIFEKSASEDRKTPYQFFADLFELQNGHSMTDEQAAYAESLFAQIQEEAKP